MSYEVDYAELGFFVLLPNQTIGLTAYWKGDLESDIGAGHWFRLSVSLDPRRNLIEDSFGLLPQTVEISKELFSVDESDTWHAAIELRNPGPLSASFIVTVISTPIQY